MNTPNKAPFFGWGFYSTPEGRGGVGSKSLIDNKVDIDLFDWQTEIAMLLKVQGANPSNPPSLFNLGFRHDKAQGQMLFLRQAQHAFEVNSSRAGTFVSAFFTTSRAYFKPQVVNNLLGQLQNMCMWQRKEYLDEQGKFKLHMDQFRSKGVPDLGLKLQDICVPANDFTALKEVKSLQWILAKDNTELAQAVEAIISAQLFKNYQEFYLTTSTEIIKNARLEPHQYILASHIIGLGNGLGSYLHEIQKLQNDIVKLNQNLGQIEQKHQQQLAQINTQHQQQLAQKDQQRTTDLSNLTNQANQAIDHEKRQHAATRANLEQQLQQQANAHAQLLEQEQQRHAQVEAQLNAYYSAQVNNQVQVYLQQRTQELDNCVAKVSQQYLNQEFVNQLGVGLVDNIVKQRPNYATQRVQNSVNHNTANSNPTNSAQNGPRTTRSEPSNDISNTNLDGSCKGKNSKIQIIAILAAVVVIASTLLFFLGFGSSSEETPSPIPPVQQLENHPLEQDNTTPAIPTPESNPAVPAPESSPAQPADKPAVVPNSTKPVDSGSAQPTDTNNSGSNLTNPRN